MTHIEFLEQLYKAHLTDLKSVAPEIGNLFVCPICFNMFPLEAIHDRELTEGHIWPNYIREKSGSSLVKSQSVLLCKTCNATAGSRGDKQMQLMEIVREGEDTGQLYGERYLQLIQDPGEKPIEIKTSVQRIGQTEITIAGHWARSNPREKERFETLIKNEQPFSVIVHPYHELKPDLTREGWVTSAYLLTFFALGYRYVFHKSITPVRKYILQSFNKKVDNQSTQTLADNFDIKEYHNQYFCHPQLTLAIPVDGKTFVHIEVDFLRYQIHLPIHFVPSVLTNLIYRAMPDFKERIPKLIKTDGYLYTIISCCKLDGHECIYDYLMGKPIPLDANPGAGG